jgi:hypothetical protein
MLRQLYDLECALVQHAVRVIRGNDQADELALRQVHVREEAGMWQMAVESKQTLGRKGSSSR